jgi:hypothetical protein
MARRKRKTLSQKVVGVATFGMPRGVRKVLGSRGLALLILLSVPVLALTGIISVQWTEGRPELSIDRERAAEVRQEVREGIQSLRDRRIDDRTGAADVVPRFGAEENAWTDHSMDWQQTPDVEERVAERFDTLRDGIADQSTEAWSRISTAVQLDEEANQPFRPFSGLREPFNGQQR